MRRGLIVADLIALPDEVIRPGMPILGINPANSMQSLVYADFDTVLPLHIPIIVDGKRVYELPTLKQVKAYAAERLGTIRIESRRLESPHSLKVSMTERYWQFKQEVMRAVLPANV